MWLTGLQLWFTVPQSRGWIILTIAVAALVTAFFYRDQLRAAAPQIVSLLAVGPRRLNQAVGNLLDRDGPRSIIGLVTISIAVLSIAAAATLRQGIAATVLLIAVGLASSFASWYLIARPRRPDPVAVVEATQSRSRLQFTIEDQADPQLFDFSNIRSAHLTVAPDEQTNHWRLGIEFSNDRTFSGWRYWFFHPLWHLTKNEGDPRLLVTTYNERAEHQGDQVAIEPYNGESVPVEIEVARETLTVRVAGVPGVNSNFPIKFHRFGRLFAWADDRRYALTVEVQIE